MGRGVVGLRRLACSFLAIAALSCSDAATSADHPIGKQAQALWTNGGFESSSVNAVPDGWTVASNLNPGVTLQDPQTLPGLNLSAGGASATLVVGGATESQADTAAPAVLYPKYGMRSAIVNYKSTVPVVQGSSQNVNSLVQQTTLTSSDIDPDDGRLHVRFVIAPILQNPGHATAAQPYYFVYVRNVTKDKVLYQDFEVSNQPGIPWLTNGAVVYTDWQLVDVAPGNADLAVNDVVEIQVIAAGCSQGGHWGRVYVDAFGPIPPGLFATATAPASANAGTHITYAVRYRNGGAVTTDDTIVDFATPPETTFVSVSPSSGCSMPALGMAGTVSCDVGSVAAAGAATLQITVAIAGSATGKLTQGNYGVRANGVSNLLGSHATTTLTNPDLSVSVSSGLSRVGWNQPITYTVVVTNSGSGPAPVVSVSDVMPGELTNVTWTCAAANGGSCSASGSGNVNDSSASLPVGASVTYTVHATLTSGSTNSSTTHSASASVTSGGVDSNTANNTASETIPVRPVRTLTVNKKAAGAVSSMPSGISCPSGCTSTTGQFVDGASVMLTATAPGGGGQFLGWGGACASAGTSLNCMLTIAGDPTLSANFAGPVATIATSAGAAQKANVNSPFADALQVIVRDSFGDPVPNASVTFTKPNTGASAGLSAGGAQTDAMGHAGVSATANGIPGAYSVSASVGGVGPAVFALSNLGPPASIVVISGDDQSLPVASAGQNPLVVEVRDAANQPLQGVQVTFGAPSSGASATLSAMNVLSDASGRASVTLSAGNASGMYSVTAGVAGLGSIATFHVTNLAGAAASIVVSSGSSQAARAGEVFGSALDTQVLDALGNSVSGASVTFAVPSSGAGATLSAYGVISDSSGHASVQPTANTRAGAYDVRASVSGVNDPATFSLTNNAGPAAGISAAPANATQNAQLQTAFAAPLAVEVSDAFGNPVGGATVHYQVPADAPNATLSNSSAQTDGGGRASVSATAGGSAGTYIVTAKLDGAPAQVDFTLTNSVGPVISVSVVSGSPASAAVTSAFASPFKVLVTREGDPLARTMVTFSAPQSGPSAQLGTSSALTDDSGFAQVEASANMIAGSYNVTASVANAAQGAVFALTNEPGAPAKFLVSPNATHQAAQIHTRFGSDLIVTVVDLYDNPVANVTVMFGAPGSGASAALSALTPTTDGQGQARVSATANGDTGKYTITAGVDGISNPAEFELENLTDPPLTLAIDSGSAQSARVDSAFAQPLKLKVSDPQGAPVPNAQLHFSVPGSGASAALSSDSALTDASGLAQVTAGANTFAGAYEVLARVEGAAAAVRFTLLNLPGEPAAISAGMGSSPQSARIGTAYRQPLRARVVDEFGNAVPGVNVEFSAPESEPTVLLTSSQPSTDLNGVASVTAIALEQIGSFEVVARLLGESLTAAFQLSNTAGEPATIVLTEGGDQTGLANQAFPNPIKVVVRDARMNLVSGAGVVVSISGEGPGGTLSSSLITTDEIGEASIEVTANGVPGSFTLSFAVEGAQMPATTVLTIENIPTLSTLTAEPLELRVGETLTLNASVTSERGTPEGDIELIVDGLTIGMLPLTDGEASATFNPSPAQTYDVRVHFAAQGPYGESSSDAIAITVLPGADGGIPPEGGSRGTSGWRVSGGGGGCSLMAAPPRAARLPGFLVLLGGLYILRRRHRP